MDGALTDRQTDAQTDTHFDTQSAHSLHGCAPRYLSELVVPTHNASSMRLRSADNHCIVRPRSRLKFGDRGFSVAAPDAWNSLPLHVKTAPSHSIFTTLLKTELFMRSYS